MIGDLQRDDRPVDNAPIETGEGGLPWGRLLGPAFLSGLFLLLTAATWRRWGDILIDFPLHLYTPWRLSLGELLYRDVANLHGPFSECYHGLLFRLLGPSVSTLIGASLALLAAQVSLLYAAFRKDSGDLATTLLCSLFLVGFAFANYTGIGNYNYILSYNYELIHGVFFATCSLLCLSRWLEGGRRGARMLLAAGFFFGLAALTKQEICLGVGLAIFAGFAAGNGRDGRDGQKDGPKGKTIWLAVGRFLLAVLLPIALFFGYFTKGFGAAEAVRVLAWPWVALLGTGASANAFHRAGMGLDDPMENLAATIQAAGVGMVLLLGVVLIFHRKVPRLVQLLAGVALLGGAWWWDWHYVCRGFPLLAPIAIGFLWREQGRGGVFPLLWMVFGFGLLAKMGINCRIWHYGYVLAMPAALGLAFVLIRQLPRKIDSFGFNGRGVALLLSGVICLGTLQLGWDSWQIYKAKTFSFSSGADQIRTFPPESNARGEAIRETVEWLDRHASPQATLAAFPQGVILNYLSKRPNPTPYLTWIVTEYNTFGEKPMLGALQGTPPDYIALVHTDTSEYGPRFFGQRGYAEQTMAWIRANYQPVFLAGKEPFKGEDFGIKLLRRLGAGTAPSHRPDRTDPADR
jgi:hypothetical protein